MDDREPQDQQERDLIAWFERFTVEMAEFREQRRQHAERIAQYLSGEVPPGTLWTPGG